MRPSRRPADRAFHPQNIKSGTANENAARHTSLYRKTGKPGSRTRNCEDHCTPGKDPNGVRWKNRCAANRVRRSPGNSSFVLWSWRRDSNPRPSDYKSDALPTELRQQSGDSRAFAQTNPSDPFRMSGTILKGITGGTSRASTGAAKGLLHRTVRGQGEIRGSSGRLI